MTKEVICVRVQYPDGTIVYEDIEAFQTEPTPGAILLDEIDLQETRPQDPLKVGQAIDVFVGVVTWDWLFRNADFSNADGNFVVQFDFLQTWRIQCIVTGLTTRGSVRGVISKIVPIHDV